MANYYHNAKTYPQEIPLPVSGTLVLNSGHYVKGEYFAALVAPGILADDGSGTPAAVTADPTLLAYTQSVTISTGSVDSAAIVDNTVVSADIASGAAIAFSKLAPLTSTNILVGNGSNVATSVAVTGDVTISNAGVTAIASGVIVNADINASAAIAYSKLAALTSTNILVGNGSNVATAVAMSGDATLSNAGALSLGAGKVVVTKVNLAAGVGGNAAVPGTATSTGVAGTAVFDGSFLYVCTATNTWFRVAVATW